jgi:N-methylhydantoinase B/oxoprolinase/acetone carboxylase alpha subunit
MYTPIYTGPQRAVLIGFFAINVHWIDIGGITPRSSDIFMEGLQLRSIKLWSKGEPIQEVYRIIENNTRFPVELLGDIAAQHAGCVLGRNITQTLADNYGVATFASAVKAILDQSEAAARARLREVPDGVYRYETFFDNDGETGEPIPIRVKVIVAGDEMTIDYSDMADQVKGCINSGYYGGGRTTARVAFKYLIANNEPANEGTFRPLKLILPEGKIISAHPTAPMGNYSQPFPTVIDAVIKALEKALPERVTGLTSAFGVRFGQDSDRRAFDCHDGATVVGELALPTTAPGRFTWLTATPASFRRAAGVDVSLSHHRVRPARRFRRRRKIPRRLGIPQKISINRRRRSAGDVRSREISAMGCARRQGWQVGSDYGRKKIRRDGNHLQEQRLSTTTW